MTSPIRLRAHIEPPQFEGELPPAIRSRQPSGLAARRAFIIHTTVDDKDRPIATFYREVLDGWTIEEGVAIHSRKGAGSIREWATRQRPDLAPGMAGEFKVLTSYQLSRKIISRCYRYSVPLVGWDLAWQLGRLAGHVGRAKDGGFSITLLGCGVEKAGRWKDSDYCPRLRITPRSSGQIGAFLRWLPCRDESSRSRTRSQCFIELANLTSAVLGGEVSGPAQGAELLDIAWAESDSDLDTGRAGCGLLVRLFHAGGRRLQELAPGLPPHKAWSTGSLVAHARRRAGISPAAAAVAGVPLSVKGMFAAAFLGPRCECHLIGIATPMALCDLRGTYPGCWSALDLTRFLIAERIELEDVTEEFDQFLRSPNLLERLLDPKTARCWGATVVVLHSSDGAELPATVEWGPSRTKGTMAPLFLPQDSSLPVPWCDVATATVRGGALQVDRVLRPVAVGVQSDLLPYRMPDGVAVDLATEDLGVAWRDYRERSGSGEAKLGGNSDTFGLPSRHDTKRLVQPGSFTGIGTHGEPHTISTRSPEYPAADTSMMLAGAVTAMCRMVIGLTVTMLEREGLTVAHVATDSVAVPASEDGGLWPCPGGSHRLAGGEPAIRLATFGQLRSILARSDPLLGHRGGPAWKEEVESLSMPTMGVVFGVNKLVLARPNGHGGWVVVRSSDADLGGHKVDATGASQRTEDGRHQWSSDLEGPLLVAAMEADPALPVPLPSDLPEFANRLALRAERASTWKELLNLRKQTCDPTIMPFARYLRAETGGHGVGPVALGHHSDPETWPTLDFRLGGESVALLVQGPNGNPRQTAGDPTARSKVVVRTIADHLARWLREVDPSMTGPRRGLRTPVPVQTHPALFRLTGRSGEVLNDGSGGPPLLFGTSGSWEDLRQQAAAIGAPKIADLADLPRRTVCEALSGRAQPTEATLAGIADAVGRAERRRCPQCSEPISGRADKRWCSDRCRKAAKRAVVKEEIVAARRALIAPGLPTPANRTWVERDPQWIERDRLGEA